MALALVAGGSLLLIGAAALSAQLAQLAGRRLINSATVVSLATAALLSAACNRADNLEPLIFTVDP